MTYPAQASAAPAATLDQTPAFDDSTIAVRAPRPAADGEGVQEAAATASAQARAVPSATTAAVAASALQAAPGPPVHHGHGPPGGDEGIRGPRGRMRRLRIGSQLASSTALAELSPAGPAAGLLLGIDQHRQPVGVRLFRPEPTRVLIVGGAWAAQLLVFRAFALGARVVVASDHEQEWLSFGRHATGRPDRLLAVPPESIASGATARTPTLIVDDRADAATAAPSPQGPWQTHVTVLSHLDPAGARAAQRCDLALLQRLSSDEAVFAAQLLRLPARSIAALEGTPDDVLALVADGTDRYVTVVQTALERSHIGAPSPRPLPPPRTLVAPPSPPPEPAPSPVPVSTPVPATIPAPPLPPVLPPATQTPATPPSAPSPPTPSPPTQTASTPAPPAPTAPTWTSPAPPSPDPGVALARPGTVPAPVSVVEPVPSPETGSRRRRPIMIGVGAIAVLTLAGWIAGFLFTGTTPTAAPPSKPAAVTPTPQEVIRPLAVATITAVPEGDGIRFTWTYDEPADGDFFRVQRTDVEDPVVERLDEPEFFVADDEACLQVTIFRRNGQGGPPEVECYR